MIRSFIYPALLLACVSCDALKPEIKPEDLYSANDIYGYELKPGEYKDGHLNATDYNMWHYFDAQTMTVVASMADTSVATPIKGIYIDPNTGAESEIDATRYDCSIPDQMRNRTDWDFALCRYKIRTNSGTSGDGDGGIYTFAEGATLASLDGMLLSDLTFAQDKVEGGADMTGDEKYEGRALATSAVWYTMPPVYYNPPLYLIRSADIGDENKSYYAVEFLGYEGFDSKGQPESGHLTFKTSKIEIK